MSGILTPPRGGALSLTDRVGERLLFLFHPQALQSSINSSADAQQPLLSSGGQAYSKEDATLDA